MKPPKQSTIVEIPFPTLKEQILALLPTFLIQNTRNHPEFWITSRNDFDILEYQVELQENKYIVTITWLPKNQYYVAPIILPGDQDKWAVFHNEAQVLGTDKHTREAAQALAHNRNHLT